jgi:hypothetical protein
MHYSIRVWQPNFESHFYECRLTHSVSIIQTPDWAYTSLWNFHDIIYYQHIRTISEINKKKKKNLYKTKDQVLTVFLQDSGHVNFIHNYLQKTKIQNCRQVKIFWLQFT